MMKKILFNVFRVVYTPVIIIAFVLMITASALLIPVQGDIDVVVYKRNGKDFMQSVQKAVVKT